ncbi:ATP-binding protein [Chitinophaga horti]
MAIVQSPEDAEVPSIGLYITAGIVRRHGGKIDVESEEGKGTAFYVTIPYREEPSVSI